MDELDKWLQGKPPIIRKLASILPPGVEVIIKATDQIASVYSYNENGTVTVVVNPERSLAERNVMSASLTPYKVFGYKPEDLLPAHTPARTDCIPFEWSLWMGDVERNVPND